MKRTNDDYASSSSDDDDEPKCCIIPLICHELLNVANTLTGDRKFIIKSLEAASQLAVNKINELAVSMQDFDVRKLLATFFAKHLSPKIFGPDPQSFTEILVDAVLATLSDYDSYRIYTPTISDFKDGSDLIGITELPGATLRDSFYVDAVACKKTPNHEFISMSLQNPVMLMLNVKLDPKLRHSDPSQSKHDKNIYGMLDKYVNHGANVVLSCQAIGDLAKQYLAEKGITCVGLFDKHDLDRVASATGTVVTSDYTFAPMILGTCQALREDKFGNQVFRVFTGCSRGKTATLVLRGSDQCIKEVKSYLPDLIVSLRVFLKDYTAVVAGPLLYRKISRYVSKEAHNVAKDSQPFVKAFAKAFKAVSRQIVGIGAPGPDVLNYPSQKHDIVYEPTSRHTDSIRAATIMARFDIRFHSDDSETDSNRKVKPAKKKTKSAKKLRRC